MKLLAVALPLIAIFSGCATRPPVSNAAAEIIVHKQNTTQLEGCKRLGPVRTDTQGGPFNYVEIAEAAFRNRAIELYGERVDSIALINQQVLPAGRIVLQGIAYDCFE